VAPRISVPAAQWKRGMLASQRLGDWLKSYEERARRAREGEELQPRRPRRRRPPRPPV
jgi:hypothetical protein